MSKKENKFIMHYDYESRKRVFRLNGRDVTVEIERLLEAHEKEIVSTKCKLFQLDMTIQQRLQNQLALTEKALELACKNSCFEDTCDYCAYKGELEITNDCPRWCETDEKFFATQTMGYFKEQAKEMMKSE